jgi:hypothetical protein
MDDDAVERLATRVLRAEPDAAAQLMAETLAGGANPIEAREALALAANALVLNDPGRAKADGPEKPEGSVHGAAVGVHAADSALAWSDLAAASDDRREVQCLISGAYNTAGQSHRVGKRAVDVREAKQRLEAKDAEGAHAELEAAVLAGDQHLAMAAVQRLEDVGGDDELAFRQLARLSNDQDGALHAEKFWCTSRREYDQARDAHRRRYLVALARVTASQQGHPAPGVEHARALLGA